MKTSPLSRRTPLKRGTKPLARSTELKSTTELRRTVWLKNTGGRLRDFTSEQSKRTYRKRWLSEHRRKIFRETPCEVTGLIPSDNAHVVLSRAKGGTYRDIVPLHRMVHRDFDDPRMTDAEFERKWERSRESIRARAKAYNYDYARSYPDEYLAARVA